MIKVEFSVRAGQGEPSGYDLGDISCGGENGTAGSAGHVPDQGMMIYPSVTLLLDSLRTLLTGEKKMVAFIGTDTSFRLDFTRDNEGFVSVSAQGTLLGRSSLDDLVRAFLRPAQGLTEGHLLRLPSGDASQSDYLAALRDLRAAMTRKQ
ncbi:hypothetical protein ACFW9O_30905 [Streptomyces sp. NPDC059499]|uniref:hypothetical protein n=1 Tax=Streptomyces sp. NPDC059499 TaxID=3346852 RepID=UPI00367A6E11